MDNEPKETLPQKLKLLQERCIYVQNALKNLPDVSPVPNNIEAEASNYVEASQTGIQNSYTAITTDSNLLTSQHLSETKQFTEEVDKFIAFTDGLINDTNAEIERINNIIKTSQEARSRARAEKKSIMNAKVRFRIIKKALHGFLYSLYPATANHIMDALGQLMREKFNATSSGYIMISDENYAAMQLLRQMELVSQNPYDRRYFKLSDLSV